MILFSQKLFKTSLSVATAYLFLRKIRISSCISRQSLLTFSTNNSSTEEVKFKYRISKDFNVVDDYITEEEEELILKDLEKTFRRVKYQYDHWDGAIVGYRETEKVTWSSSCRPILNRMQGYAFDNKDDTIDSTHVLDLAEDGCIKPHIDSIKFCGPTIAGLSLLSPCIMRLKEESSGCVADFVLKRRSLYIMRDHVRFNCFHEVLSNEESTYQDKILHKSRRISLIMRNKPK